MESEAKCKALGRGEAETPCHTMVKHKVCYQEHAILTQLMAGLNSQEWRMRVFLREWETTLKSTVTFLEKCKSGLMNSTNVEKFGAGALSALGTKPKPKQPPKPGKKSGARTNPDSQCMGCGSEAQGWVQGGQGKTLPCLGETL